MGFWKGVGDFFKGVGTSIKNTAIDIKDVGAQVVGGVFDAGKAVLEGGKTLITDPVQFAKDVKYGVSGWTDHMKDSWNKGIDTIQSGIEDAKNGRSLWHAVGNTFSGIAQMGSFGISDAVQDHLEDSMVEEKDDMGNVIGYSTKEGTDAITRIFVRDNGDKMAINKNAEEEIHEALAEGDVEKARELDKERFWATTGDDLKKAGTAAAIGGTLAAGILATPFTGGASNVVSVHAAMMIAFAGGAAGQIGSLAYGSNKAAFDVNNVKDDAADMAAAKAAEKVASGEISEDMAEFYESAARTVYEATGYNGVTDFAEQTGFESKEDLIDFAFQGVVADAARKGEDVGLAAATAGGQEALFESSVPSDAVETAVTSEPEMDPEQAARQAENAVIIREALELA